MAVISFIVPPINYGATEIVYIAWAANTPGTTNTLGGSPTYRLFDANGVPVTGYDGIPVTGFENVPLAAPRIWEVINTLNPILPPGQYTIAKYFSSTNSGDGLMRSPVECGILTVAPVP